MGLDLGRKLLAGTVLRHLLKQGFGSDGFIHDVLCKLGTFAALIGYWQVLRQISHGCNAVLPHFVAEGFVGYCVAQANVHKSDITAVLIVHANDNSCYL